MSDAHSRPANLLGALVDSLAAAVDEAVRTVGGQGGLAPAVLLQLAQHPDLSVDDVRRRVGLTHSGVVRLVDGLVVRGLVVRRRSGPDARVTYLRLTASGARLARRVAQARRDVLTGALAHLQPAQRRALVDAMEVILYRLPDSADHGSQVCRLCWLADCPQQDCPVEQRYQELVEDVSRR